jgi:tetratricopeptide (TPR) repeat protein
MRVSEIGTGRGEEMAKKKRVHPTRDPARALSRQLLNALEEVEALLEDGEEEEARLLLDDLDRRYPRNEHVLSLLVNLAHDQQDMETYQYAVEQLLRITPNDATLILGLIAAYISNGRPALAIRTARSFLDRWPDHSQAGDVRKVVSGVESFLPMIRKIRSWRSGRSDWSKRAGHCGSSAADVEKMKARASGHYARTAVTIAKATNAASASTTTISMKSKARQRGRRDRIVSPRYPRRRMAWVSAQP